jgi:hypothetical protein
MPPTEYELVNDNGTVFRLQVDLGPQSAAAE